MLIQKRQRQYYSQDQQFSDDILLQEAHKIVETPIHSAPDLEIWLKKWSELAMIGYEILASLYIEFLRNADNEVYRQKFTEFNSKIWDQFEICINKVAKKYYTSPYRHELPAQRYAHLDTKIANEIDLFSDKNGPLRATEQQLIAKLNTIDARQTFHFQGEDKTYYQMAPYLRSEEKSIREEAWYCLYEGFLSQSESINSIMSELISLRIQLARNAGVSDYIHFRHLEMERFSYTPADIQLFHDTVEKEIIPVLKEMMDQRKKSQGLAKWRPWDAHMPTDTLQYRPPSTTEEFVQTSIQAVNTLHRDYGSYLKTLHDNNLLDLEQRKGKMVGTSNTNLLEQGTSFISMHLTHQYNDMVSLFHEFGHSLHTRVMNDETLITYLFPPIEVSELASKSFELFMTESWKKFFKTERDSALCKKKLLQQALFSIRTNVLCDAFNLWIYSNPDHTAQERMAHYRTLQERFQTGVDWAGLDNQKSVYWISSYHVIRQPFSEIGYAFAQLGALALYKQFKEDKDTALHNFERFLKLGSSRSVPEIYETAGISFDFSHDYVRSIMAFIQDELQVSGR